MTRNYEITPKCIIPESLQLVGEKPILACADTVDHRRVVFKGIVFGKDFETTEKLESAIELASFAKPDDYFIIDENAVVQGASMWRRGREPESVRIVQKPEIDAHIRHAAHRPESPQKEQEFLDWFCQYGVWMVIENSHD